MKIEVFDRIVNVNDDRSVRFDAERMQLILEGLESLERFETKYYIFGEDTFTQEVLAVVAQEGMSALPLTYVDGVLFKRGQYMSDDEVMSLTGIHFEIVDNEEEHHEHSHDGGCSCGHHH